MEGLKGLDALVKTLDGLKDKASKKAARAGVNAGLTVLAKAMRSAVNSSSASPNVKRRARDVIGKRLQKAQGQTTGKAGFGVGKRGKKYTQGLNDYQGAREQAERKGVGISASNIHWFILGTAQRRQINSRRKPNKGGAGRLTGRVQSSLQGVVSSAASSAGPAMLEAARNKITQVLAAEAAKAKKG